MAKRSTRSDPEQFVKDYTTLYDRLEVERTPFVQAYLKAHEAEDEQRLAQIMKEKRGKPRT